MTTHDQLLSNIMYWVDALEGRNPDFEGPPRPPGRAGEAGAYEIIEDALDLEFTIDSHGRYRGSTALMAVGGPTIWIDTRTERVHGSWGADQMSRGYDDTVDLGGALEDYYDGLHGADRGAR